jgi:hypothetical protein
MHDLQAISFTSGWGRPALAPRLVAGLLYLQHAFDASDEAVVNTWVENPYWQYFTGLPPGWLCRSGATPMPNSSSAWARLYAHCIEDGWPARCQDLGDHYPKNGS